MSAYICDRDHIAYIVQSAMSRRINGGYAVSWYHGNPATWNKLDQLEYEKAADVANMLVRENYRSVSHRYPHDKTSTSLPGPKGGVGAFTRRDFAVIKWHSFDPAQVLKACHCYEYQACETDDWESTEAHAFIKGLISAACRAVAGYEAAEWGAPAPECQAICLSALAGAKPTRKFNLEDLFDAAG